MDKKHIVLILLLSSLVMMLLSLSDHQQSGLFLYLALGISVIAAEITFLPDNVLNKKIAVGKVFSYPKLWIKRTLFRVERFLSGKSGKPSKSFKFVSKGGREQERDVEEAPSVDTDEDDEESWREIISWWLTTPVAPVSFFEWILALLFVIIVSLFLYCALDRFLDGHEGWDIFLIWRG